MEDKKTKYIYIVSSIILIILVLAFTSTLNISTYKKNYTDSLVSSYKVVGSDPVRKIEFAVKYGKDLGNFYGMEDLLSETKKDAPDLKEVSILSKDGKILYSTDDKNKNKIISSDIKNKLSFDKRTDKDADINNIYVLSGSKYHNILPIYDNENNNIGSMDMTFNKSLVDNMTNDYIQKLLKYALILCLAGGIFLMIFFFKMSRSSSSEKVSRKKNLIAIIATLSLIQIIYGSINFVMFRDSYLSMSKDYISNTGVIIQKDLNYIAGKDVNYSELNDTKAWLSKFMKSAPEIDNINIVGNNNNIIFSTGKTGVYDEKAIDSAYLYKMPLNKDISDQAASIKIEISKSYIQGKTRNILLDMLTVLVTSFFFLVEISIFLLVLLDRKVENKSEANKEIDVKIARPLSFIFYFAAFLSLSFIPVIMKSFYKPMLGISENVILGLPITVELICAGIGIFFSGYLLEEKGWKPVFIFGLMFFCVGAVLSGFASSAVTFIGARGLYGFGYGLCMIAMQGFVNSALSVEKRNEGISSLNSGAFAGINCGCALGAMMADRIGYSHVFFVTFTIAIFSGLFAFFFMKNSKLVKKTENDERKNDKRSSSKFVLNKKVITFFLFIVIPIAICGMFIEYYVPVYAMNKGISTGNVGRIILVNGLVVVYLGPVVSRFTSKFFSIKSKIILASAMIISSFVLFTVVNNFAAAIITAILLGIVTGFGDGAQNNYLLSLPQVDEFGEGKAISLFNVTTKVGQASGPLIFGSFMALGVVSGVGAIGIVFAALVIIFLTLNR